MSMQREQAPMSSDREPDHLSFMPMNRRGFLSGLLAGGAAAGLAGGLLATPRTARAWQAPSALGGTPARRAKNVIMMVSDGMSQGTLSLADMVCRAERGRASNWIAFNNRAGVRRALQNTSALDSLVTDSAAAATAWGSGRRVKIGSINVAADGTQQMPLYVRARQHGKMTGVVTTTRITHATPAGFYANVPIRDMEGIIARDLLDRKIDVALGGGERFFPAWNLDKHADLRVVRNKDELLAAPAGGPLLGLFDVSHIPFAIEREASVPGLVDMTSAALRRLEGAPDGFVLQIEAGRVDHAAHNNDAAALLSEQLEFDDALGAVMKWIDGRDDTLLIVTTDHGNASPSLTMYREQGEQGLSRLRRAPHSFDWIDARIESKKDVAVAALRDVLQECSAVNLGEQEVDLVARTMRGDRVSAFKAANKWTSVLGAALADHFGVAFVSPNHTADLVEVSATGPGSEMIPAYVENHQLHGVIVSALGLGEGKALEGMNVPMLPPRRPTDD